MNERGDTDPVRVTLELRDHCVGTAARHELRRVEGYLLSMTEDDPRYPPLASAHDLLGRFLEQTDLPELRASRPELDGHLAVRVQISETASGEFVIEVL